MKFTQLTSSNYLFLAGFLVILTCSTCCAAAARNFTTAEKAALIKFRPMVSNMLYRSFMQNDDYLMTWLRARKLNLELAKEMLEKNLEWRKTNKIDTIMDEDMTYFEKAFPYVIEGTDKEGRPLLIVPVGLYNIRKAVLAGQMAGFNRYLDRSFEMGRMVAEKSNVTQGVMLMDLYGFNPKTHACLNCVPVFVHFTMTYENYYPDLCHKFYFFNAPKVFEIVEDAIRPFQSDATKAAYNLFSHNKDEWQKVLLADINPEQLPIRFGGTKILKNRHGVVIN